MSGLARGADLRNIPVQGRKVQPVEQKSCALSAFVMLGRRAVNRFTMVSLTESTTVATASHARSLGPSRARYPGQMPDAP